MAHITPPSSSALLCGQPNGDMAPALFANELPRISPEMHSPSAIAVRSSAEEPLAVQPTTVWLAGILSGTPELDELHRGVLTELAEVSATQDGAFCSAYEVFVLSLERTFRQEELWMDEIDFPGLKTHQEQHARVLGALHNVHARVMEGELRLGREVVGQLLPQWFAFHISTMDAPLAVMMQIVQAEGTKVEGLPEKHETPPLIS